jgi:hypothetical protein
VGERVLSGPIPGAPRLGLMAQRMPMPAGFLEEEWFLSGTASSFRAEDTPADDGRWLVSRAGTAPFTTRLLVRRPEDPSRFNGTVVVEWLNVSAGADSAPVWSFAHRHLTRAGFAWVGVTAQRAGVSGGGLVPGPHLQRADPTRYASLEHPGDAFSFDMFTAGGEAVRDGLGSILGPLRPDRLLAVAESQSALFLTTYLNAVAAQEQVFDGYLVHSRAGSAAPLDGRSFISTDTDVETGARAFRAAAIPIRTDLTSPVLVLQSETDVIALGSLAARQPDTDRFRLWEIAGAAHADTYVLGASLRHTDGTSAEQLAQFCAPTNRPMGPFLRTGAPINSGIHHHYVAQAAIACLDRWVRTGVAPPSAPVLEVTGDPPALLTDELGIACGGIRTGQVDVPCAVLSGIGQTGPAFTVLFGTTRPFDAATLHRLYPGGRQDYAERFAAATEDVVRAGFLLAEDAAELTAVAVAMYPTD